MNRSRSVLFRFRTMLLAIGALVATGILAVHSQQAPPGSSDGTPVPPPAFRVEYGLFGLAPGQLVRLGIVNVTPVPEPPVPGANGAGGDPNVAPAPFNVGLFLYDSAGHQLGTSGGTIGAGQSLSLSLSYDQLIKTGVVAPDQTGRLGLFAAGTILHEPGHRFGQSHGGGGGAGRGVVAPDHLRAFPPVPCVATLELLDEATGRVTLLVPAVQSGNDINSLVRVHLGGGAALSDITGTLVSGAGTLSNGSGTLNNGTGTLTNGSGTLSNGSGTLSNGSGTLTNGTGTLTNGSGTLTNGTGTLSNGSGTLVNGSGTLIIGSGTLGGVVAPDRLLFGLVGLAKGQTARVNVVQFPLGPPAVPGANGEGSPPPGDFPAGTPVNVELVFIDLSGNVVLRSEGKVGLGRGLSLDLPADLVLNNALETQVRASIRVTGLGNPPVGDFPPNPCRGTLEIFDSATGWTSAIALPAVQR